MIVVIEKEMNFIRIVVLTNVRKVVKREERMGHALLLTQPEIFLKECLP